MQIACLIGAGGGRGAGAGAGAGTGAAAASAPPHAHLQFMQFHLHFIFSIRFPRSGDTFKHTWHLHGFGIIAGFTIGRHFANLFSIGLNTVGSIVLHIFIGATMTGGNGFGLTSTDLQEHRSHAGAQLQWHAAPFIWKAMEKQLIVLCTFVQRMLIREHDEVGFKLIAN